MKKQNQLTAYIIKFVKKNAPNRYYIGSSTDVKLRIEGYKNDIMRSQFMKYCQNHGYEWSEDDIQLIDIQSQLDEDHITEKYMMIHGSHDFQNVRGGTYTQRILNSNQIETLRRKKLCFFDLCYDCGSKNHKVGSPDCQNKCYNCNHIVGSPDCKNKYFDIRNCPLIDDQQKKDYLNFHQLYMFQQSLNSETDLQNKIQDLMKDLDNVKKQNLNLQLKINLFDQESNEQKYPAGQLNDLDLDKINEKNEKEQQLIEQSILQQLQEIEIESQIFEYLQNPKQTDQQSNQQQKTLIQILTENQKEQNMKEAKKIQILKKKNSKSKNIKKNKLEQTKLKFICMKG